MKIRAGSVDTFVRKPDPAILGILVYGPDDGLVSERVDKLVRMAVGGDDDPFLLSELTGEVVAGDPPRLADEAASIPLTGGRKVVRVRDASPSAPGMADRIARAVSAFLEAPVGDALVVLQAGNLGPRAPLRRIFEEASNAVALPCYADDAQTLDRLIDETFGGLNITATADARAYLTANLGVDRGVSRAELEKLALYAGAGGRVELADAQACIGDNALRTLDGIVFAAADGDRAGLDRELAASLEEGANPVTILRATARHLMRLHWIAARLDRGETPKKAVQGLQPPIFVLHVDRIVAQAKSWPPAAIARALALVLDAERQCKRTGMPATAICGRALLQVASLARRRPA